MHNRLHLRLLHTRLALPMRRRAKTHQVGFHNIFLRCNTPHRSAGTYFSKFPASQLRLVAIYLAEPTEIWLLPTIELTSDPFWNDGASSEYAHRV